MSRPEHISPPEIFYNEAEAVKYARSTRMIEIQARLSERAIELLALPQDQTCMILDIGCGSGLSGQCLEEAGHMWVGTDISPDMLNVAIKRGTAGTNGDVSQGDMGQGLAFRAGMFDGAISISALQWLFYPAKKCHNPHKRLFAFFHSLYASLHRGARAVLQFYPEKPQQMEMAVRIATQCGFTGGLVVDFPNSTKAKKYYLCITAGTSHTYLAAKQDDGGATAGTAGGFAVRNEARRAGPRSKRRRQGKRIPKKSRDWIRGKKDRQRRQGKDVRPDSKYSGRRRHGRF